MPRCASPGSEMYPFDVDGEFRQAEGGVKFNAAWNVGLAYFAWDEKGKALDWSQEWPRLFSCQTNT